jgi:hypothetical protein
MLIASSARKRQYCGSLSSVRMLNRTASKKIKASALKMPLPQDRCD